MPAWNTMPICVMYCIDSQHWFWRALVGCIRNLVRWEESRESLTQTVDTIRAKRHQGPMAPLIVPGSVGTILEMSEGIVYMITSLATSCQTFHYNCSTYIIISLPIFKRWRGGMYYRLHYEVCKLPVPYSSYAWWSTAIRRGMNNAKATAISTMTTHLFLSKVRSDVYKN